MVERSAQASSANATIASDLPKGVALLADLTTNLNNVRATFDALAEKIKNDELNTAKGISLLDLKNQSFLTYMSNLTYLTLRKLKGVKIEGDPSIDRLVEMRVVLERIRPLEDKLKYQVDKHVKTATEGVVSGDDPSRLKGNIDNIGSSSDEDDDDNVTKVKKTEDEDQKIYKVPKISQTHYDGEADKNEAKEKARRRVLNSNMLRDALYEITEDPEVVYNTDILKQNAMKKRRELETYEEENMIRKVVSRRDRAAMQQVTTLGTMGSEIMGFNNMDALHQDYDPAAPAAKKQKTGKSSKSSKSKGKGKSKGKKGFKKRRKQ